MPIRVALSPPEAPLPAVERYRRSGSNDDCLPFNSGNLAVWRFATPSPLTSQTVFPMCQALLRSLPAPFQGHLIPESIASPAALDSNLTPLSAAALVDATTGHMAANLGGVCTISRDAATARADVTAILAWLGPRPRCFKSSQLFSVGACWSYAYLALTTSPHRGRGLLRSDGDSHHDGNSHRDGHNEGGPNGRLALWLFLQID